MVFDGITGTFDRAAYKEDIKYIEKFVQVVIQ